MKKEYKQIIDNYIKEDWEKLCKNEKLSEDFIREFKDKVSWYNISIHQKLSEDFIREFKDKVNWTYVSIHQKLSEDFIREFKDKVDWNSMSKYQKLSEDFIREFKDKVNWNNISIDQKLSEDFIREFKDKVDWISISIYQKLSEDFIKKFKNKVDWTYVSKYQKLSEDFIREFKDKVDKCYIEDSWHYKSTESKKKAIVSTGLYDCYKNYFIAYKAIRPDRYSHFNFQYQYNPKGAYESFCDTSNNKNSFGLSVWTKEKAKEFDSSGLIVKCKVFYKDIGRLVHDSNKVRCFKITILD